MKVKQNGFFYILFVLKCRALPLGTNWRLVHLNRDICNIIQGENLQCLDLDLTLFNQYITLIILKTENKRNEIKLIIENIQSLLLKSLGNNRKFCFNFNWVCTHK